MAFADVETPNARVEFAFPDQETPNPNVEVAFPGAHEVSRELFCAGGSVVDGGSVSGEAAGRQGRGDHRPRHSHSNLESFAFVSIA